VLLAEVLEPGVERLDLGFEEAILTEQAIRNPRWRGGRRSR
jgi:hypothetical protein